MPLLLRRANPTLVIARAAGPDERGYFSLGTNADYTAAFIGEVPFFLEVTPTQPFTYGQNQIHASQLAGWIRTDAGLPPIASRRPSAKDEAIAGHIAELIPDGACLQVGVGSIPDALLATLRDHRDLGIHTEALSDGLMDLVERGVATGSRKRQHRNKHVATFTVGSPQLMHWLDHNPSVEMMPVDWTNDPRVVAHEPNFVSINATTEVDLMGQAASETMAGRLLVLIRRTGRLRARRNVFHRREGISGAALHHQRGAGPYPVCSHARQCRDHLKEHRRSRRDRIRRRRAARGKSQ